MALSWLRYGKRYPIVATESGHWKCDVIGMNSQHATEIEVKISKSDLRAEFKHKKSKHFVYMNSPGSAYTPNSFYFLVPDEIADAAVEQTGDTPFGVISCHSETAVNYSRDLVTVVKRARPLKEGPPHKYLVREAQLRMGSELCGLRFRSYETIDKIASNLTRHLQQAEIMAKRNHGFLDVERAEEDFEDRLRELAASFGEDVSTPELRQKYTKALKSLQEADYFREKDWDYATHRF